MAAINRIPQAEDASSEDIYGYLAALFKQATAAYLAQEQITVNIEQLPIDLRPSAQADFGDYSVPVMSWAAKNKLGLPPLQIAESLAASFKKLSLPDIQEITVTPPGYLNFRLDRQAVGQ